MLGQNTQRHRLKSPPPVPYNLRDQAKTISPPSTENKRHHHPRQAKQLEVSIDVQEGKRLGKRGRGRLGRGPARLLVNRRRDRLGPHDRQGGDHLDQRRVMVVEPESMLLPVGDTGRQVNHFVNGRVLLNQAASAKATCRASSPTTARAVHSRRHLAAKACSCFSGCCAERAGPLRGSRSERDWLPLSRLWNGVACESHRPPVTSETSRQIAYHL